MSHTTDRAEFIATDETPGESLDAFMGRLGIRATVRPTGHNPHMADSRDMDHWRVTLRRGRARMTIIFSMGSGHHGQPPTGADVLDCLISDSSVEQARDFADWAEEMGFDSIEDYPTAHRSYRATMRQTKKLRAFLGEHYEAALDTERL